MLSDIRWEWRHMRSQSVLSALSTAADVCTADPAMTPLERLTAELEPLSAEFSNLTKEKAHENIQACCVDGVGRGRHRAFHHRYCSDNVAVQVGAPGQAQRR